MGDVDKAMRSEALTLIVKAVEKGKVRAVDTFVEDIVARHPGIKGADADWYRVCAYGWTRHIVRDCMRGFEPNPDDEKESQLVMDGFERLQIAYTLKRDGIRLLVPLSQMTSAECRAKAEEYRHFAAGALVHANELTRYADSLDN